MKNLMKFVLSLMVLMNVSACGNSAPEVKRREVEIYGTTYTVPEDWLVEEMNDTSTVIYCQKEKPESVDNAIFVTQIKNVLNGAAYYSQSETYVELLKNTMISNGQVGSDCTETDYDKPETAGVCLKGVKDGVEVDMYIFMNNYTDAVVIQYFHNTSVAEEYHEEARKIVDTMKFSYDGFRPDPTAESKPSSGNNTSQASDSSDKELAKRVYNWCQERFNYYDEKEGYYTGDKHDDDVFNDAADHFNMSVSEVRKLYDDGGVYVVRGE